MRHIPTIYLLLCVVAVVLFVVSLPAIAAEKADPLGGVFVLLVSLPWILILNLVGEVPLVVTGITALVGMTLNFAILRWLVTRRRQPGPEETSG